MPVYTEIKNGKKTYIAHVSKRIDGKRRVKKRRGLTSKAKAERVCIRLLMELEDLKNNQNVYTFKEWSEKCLEKMRVEFRESTIKNYESCLNKWINPILGQLKLEDISSNQVHHLIFNQTATLSLEGKRGVLKKLKRLFAMAFDEGLVKINPTNGIKVKVPEPQRLVLNKAEIEKLLNYGNKIQHPFYNHWVMALLTGMRSGELYSLRWSDIDFEGDFISVTKAWSSKEGHGATKNRRNRTVPMSKALKKFLLELKTKTEQDSGYVLEHLSEWTNGEQAKALKSFCQQIGITPVKFHDLRATFITQLLLQGVPVAKVMKIVGHHELKTTMVYLRLVATDIAGATEALNFHIPSNEPQENVISFFK